MVQYSSKRQPGFSLVGLDVCWLRAQRRNSEPEVQQSKVPWCFFDFKWIGLEPLRIHTDLVLGLWGQATTEI